MDTDHLLATADACLLAPYDLEARRLDDVFGALAAPRMDQADLYFQYTRAEGWSLEEGIVKAGSFAIEQGVGVRAMQGERTAFAYSDEISFDALQDAARATRAIARQGGGRPAHLARRRAAINLWIRSPPSTRAPRWRCWKSSSACAARATRALAR
jgi:TldD protein